MSRKWEKKKKKTFDPHFHYPKEMKQQWDKENEKQNQWINDQCQKEDQDECFRKLAKTCPKQKQQGTRRIGSRIRVRKYDALR